ncbi:hypothetical protein Bealeia1_02055 (plasmid) [Candidatus Bealeia paramacronuclearis]|uniref:Uncharacterized protein n=1 Tax=Candidatus Bealeia paramacronuclearis TaxID=1921001 RepID=A0ABZ2C5V0_9PROT
MAKAIAFNFKGQIRLLWINRQLSEYLSKKDNEYHPKNSHFHISKGNCVSFKTSRQVKMFHNNFVMRQIVVGMPLASQSLLWVV